MDADQLLQSLFARDNAGENYGTNDLINDSQEDLETRLELDYDLDSIGVLERIESCALWLVEQIASGQLPDLCLGGSSAGDPDDATGSANILSLAGKHTESAERYARLWQVLNISHELLCADACAAQRELHYRLKATEAFKSHSHLASAVQDAVKLLRVPRSLLGIACSGKGLVAGHLRIYQPNGEEIDCGAQGGRGHLIPGNLPTIQAYSYTSTAQCILVVEKETVFQRLVAARLFDILPIVMVCGKGVPDLATRVLLSSLHASFPSLPCVGLVDWNPSGVGILSIYRWGSPRMVESTRYTVPLQWLGARAYMLENLPCGSGFQDLTPRDRSLIPSLLSRLAPEWVYELERMQASGSKAELEAVYDACGGAEGFVSMIAQALQRGEWV